MRSSAARARRPRRQRVGHHQQRAGLHRPPVVELRQQPRAGMEPLAQRLLQRLPAQRGQPRPLHRVIRQLAVGAGDVLLGQRIGRKGGRLTVLQSVPGRGLDAAGGGQAARQLEGRDRLGHVGAEPPVDLARREPGAVQQHLGPHHRRAVRAPLEQRLRPVGVELLRVRRGVRGHRGGRGAALAGVGAGGKAQGRRAQGKDTPERGADRGVVAVHGCRVAVDRWLHRSAARQWLLSAGAAARGRQRPMAAVDDRDRSMSPHVSWN